MTCNPFLGSVELFMLTFAFAASNYFPAKVHPQSTIDRSIADTPWSQSEQQSEEYVEDGDENEDDSLHASFTHKHTHTHTE